MSDWILDEGILVTYKFFNHRKNRLSIFAVDNKDGTARMYVFKCSREDQFTKQEARKAFVTYRNGIDKYHPVIITVPIVDNFKKTFMNFCHNNFYKMDTMNVYYRENVLVKGGHYIVVGKPRIITKINYI